MEAIISMYVAWILSLLTSVLKSRIKICYLIKIYVHQQFDKTKVLQW